MYFQLTIKMKTLYAGLVTNKINENIPGAKSHNKITQKSDLMNVNKHRSPLGMVNFPNVFDV